MIDPSVAVMDSVLATLKGNSGVTAIVGQRVFANRPTQGAAFPYISLGDPLPIPFDNARLNGSSTYLQIDAWVRADEPDARIVRRALLLRAAIAAALNQTRPAIAGFIVHNFWIDQLGMMRDPDGVTTHSWVTIQADMTPEGDC